MMYRLSCRALTVCLTAIGIATLSGCFSPWFSRGEDNRLKTRRDEIRGKLESVDRPTIINEIGSPALLTQTALQNLGLVTQLHSTGGKVAPSSQREKLLEAMRRNEADEPNTVLDDPSTTMVVAKVNVPPAARKGDVYDIAVKLAEQATASDLEHGWLLSTPLMEMRRLGGQVREGFEHLNASGPIVTQQQITGNDSPEARTSGVIIGGGRLLKSRQLGISIDGEFADALTMGAIVPAINERFTYFDGRAQTGIATPQEDSYIEIEIPPKYARDPFHFINVVLRVSFNESETKRLQRIDMLIDQLREPTTVRNACWQLEAMGESSLPMLAAVLDHANPEIRFYAAHSMAYLNDVRAIPTLISLCRQEPAFRAMCLNGLLAIESYEAVDAMRELLHAADPEVKFGAVLALRQRDASDAEVTGTRIGETGSILSIASNGPPLVAISLQRTAEFVIFGDSPELFIPTFAYANPRIIVSSAPDGSVTVSHFQAGRDDRIVSSDADLRSVLAAISEVGGTYGDWVNFTRECHSKGYFIEPLALNPVPTAGRTYERASEDELVLSESIYANTFIAPKEDNSESSQAGGSSKSTWYNPLSWGGSD